MKAKELIDKIQEMIDLYGNCDIIVYDDYLMEDLEIVDTIGYKEYPKSSKIQIRVLGLLQ